MTFVCWPTHRAPHQDDYSLPPLSTRPAPSRQPRSSLSRPPRANPTPQPIPARTTHVDRPPPPRAPQTTPAHADFPVPSNTPHTTTTSRPWPSLLLSHPATSWRLRPAPTALFHPPLPSLGRRDYACPSTSAPADDAFLFSSPQSGTAHAIPTTPPPPTRLLPRRLPTSPLLVPTRSPRTAPVPADFPALTRSRHPSAQRLPTSVPLRPRLPSPAPTDMPDPAPSSRADYPPRHEPARHITPRTYT